METIYHRYGNADGLDKMIPPPPPPDRIIHEPYGVVIIVVAVFLTAAGFYFVSRIVVSNPQTQSACLLMDAQR